MKRNLNANNSDLFRTKFYTKGSVYLEAPVRSLCKQQKIKNMEGNSDIVATIIFIMTVSAAFPMMGYFLDWKHHRKQYTVKKEDAERLNNQ